MAKCVFCDVPLTTDNAHSEHVIPNALGGKLKSNKLDCSKCNETYGSKCDAAIAHDLNPFANLLNVHRGRGYPQPIKGVHNGKPIRLNPGGKTELAKPEFRTEETDTGLKVQIQARSMREAKAMLEGLKRKYPKLDVNKALADAQVKSEYSNEFINFNFTHGGSATFQAIMKMAFLFFKLKRPGVKLANEKELIDFINGHSSKTAVSWYFPEPEIVERQDGRVLHALILKGYPSEKLLLAFVDLFSVLSFVVVLSDDFSEDLEEKYVFDVIGQKELPSALLNTPRLDRKAIETLLAGMPSPSDKITTRFMTFLSISMLRQQKEYLSELLGDAVEGYFKKFPQGTTITHKMITELCGEIMEKVRPLITRKWQKDP